MENPLYYGKLKHFKHVAGKVWESLPFFVLTALVVSTCIGLGVVGTLFFQQYKIQNPVIVSYQCFVCKLTPSPTPTKRVEVKAKGTIIHKFDASGESKLIK